MRKRCYFNVSGVNKFTGALGKVDSNDANAEFIA